MVLFHLLHKTHTLLIDCLIVIRHFVFFSFFFLRVEEMSGPAKNCLNGAIKTGKLVNISARNSWGKCAVKKSSL